MTLIAVVRDVCATVGVVIPTSVFTNINSNRTMQEMLSLANETAQRIAHDSREWTRLKATATYVGDGVTTAFNLPANFQRLLLTSNVWKTTTALYPLRFVPDLDEWMNRRAMFWDDPHGEWTIYGGQMHISPVLGTDTSAYYAYLDKNCIALASGGFSEIFMQDGDSFVLDERLLKLGMIWQWKAQKGSPYNEDLGNYQDALSYAMKNDGPAPTIVGRRAYSASTRVAYPFPVPTP